MPLREFNVQSVDLTRRRELKPKVCLKIAPSVRVECAGRAGNLMETYAVLVEVGALFGRISECIR